MVLSRYYYKNFQKKKDEIESTFLILGSAYELDAFVKSCPSDQEIVMHWTRREISPREYLQLTTDEPKTSLDIPRRFR